MNMRTSSKLLVVAFVALAILACDVNTNTPSGPQATAGALNSTYEMWTTQTAVANTSTPTPFEASRMPIATLAPTVVPTSSIHDVGTACPDTAICEIGTPINWPGGTDVR